MSYGKQIFSKSYTKFRQNTCMIMMYSYNKSNIRNKRRYEKYLYSSWSHVKLWSQGINFIRQSQSKKVQIKTSIVLNAYFKLLPATIIDILTVHFNILNNQIAKKWLYPEFTYSDTLVYNDMSWNSQRYRDMQRWLWSLYWCI